MSANRYSEIELGMLQMQVLWLLSKKPEHGYTLIRELNGLKSTKISAGVLYPVLQRLERLGLIKARKEGRKKVYHITAKGARALRRNCMEFCRTFGGIFKDFVCKVCK